MIYQVHEIEVFEGIVNFIVMFIFLIGLILSVIALQKNRSQTKFFVTLLMISGFLYTFSNIFEKFEMWDKADEFGDAFILFFATILLIIGVVVILEEKLHTSEKKYREAYNRLIFYKDLFTHDMSNVVQNIRISSDISFENFKKFDKSKIAETLEVIKEQSIRGTNLITKVRKLSKLEESKSKLTQVNVITILNDIIRYIKKTFQNKPLNIIVEVQEDDYIINGNEFLIDIFANILINAINYNDHTSVEIQIIITKEYGKDDKKYLILEIKDNGIGISDVQKEFIFLKGFETEKRSRGMGLGLSLVKQIIELYQGEINVENRILEDYTKGSNFILKFPLVLLKK